MYKSYCRINMVILWVLKIYLCKAKLVSFQFSQFLFQRSNIVDLQNNLPVHQKV